MALCFPTAGLFSELPSWLQWYSGSLVICRSGLAQWEVPWQQGREHYWPLAALRAEGVSAALSCVFRTERCWCRCGCRFFLYKKVKCKLHIKNMKVSFFFLKFLEKFGLYGMSWWEQHFMKKLKKSLFMGFAWKSSREWNSLERNKTLLRFSLGSSLRLTIILDKTFSLLEEDSLNMNASRITGC